MNISNRLQKRTQKGSSHSKAKTFAYRVEDGIYINLTNRCSNSCDFCLRNNSDSAYKSDCLWLLYEPSAEEVIDAIGKIYFDGCKEFVFCGYGEPTFRIDTLIETAKLIRKKYTQPIRIDTNGQGNLINKRDITPELKGVVDTVSISLNCSNAKDYQALCHSVYGEQAFEEILDFGKKCVRIIPNVIFSVVETTLSDEDIEKCRAIVNNIGAKFRVRLFISDNDQNPEIK